MKDNKPPVDLSWVPEAILYAGMFTLLCLIVITGYK